MISSYSILFGHKNMLHVMSIAKQGDCDEDEKIIQDALFWRSVFFSSLLSLAICFIFCEEKYFIAGCSVFSLLIALSGKMLYDSSFALICIFFRIKENALKMLDKTIK